MIPVVAFAEAPNAKLVGASFASESELTAAISKRWPLVALEAFCKPEREQSNYPLQPPLVLKDSNWHGSFEIGQDVSAYKISWNAIVIKKKLEVYVVSASRGKEFWILEYDGNPDLIPYVPGKIPRLIKESEQANQALQHNAYARHASCGAAVAPSTGVADL